MVYVRELLKLLEKEIQLDENCKHCIHLDDNYDHLIIAMKYKGKMLNWYVDCEDYYKTPEELVNQIKDNLELEADEYNG
jgi:hypothetical protein